VLIDWVLGRGVIVRSGAVEGRARIVRGVGVKVGVASFANTRGRVGRGVSV